MYYYDRHSHLVNDFDAAEDAFRLRRLYHEAPDRMGYLPSYRNYSVISPEFLHPLSSDHWQRKEEARRMRIQYSPFDTRDALANDILEDRRRRLADPAGGRPEKYTPRSTVISSASAPTYYRAGRPSLRAVPASLEPALEPDFYMVRAKTPAADAPKAAGEKELPVDIVPVGKGGKVIEGSSAGYYRPKEGPARTYYTDENYPEHFFESAPSLSEMIIKD